MDKIYITGANGFIGTNLVNYLAKGGFQIITLLRKNAIPSFDLKRNISIVYGDLNDIESLKNTIPPKCIVINLAANPYHPKLSYLVNVDGTNNLIKVSEKKSVKHFIHISSQATKIKQQGVYAKTKNLSDKLVKESNLAFTILKPSLVYGGGEKGLFNKIKMLISLTPYVPVFGSGNTRFNPIHVEDFCKLVNNVVKDGKIERKTYDVGSEKTVTYNQFYQLAIKYLAKKAKILHIPTFIGIILGKIFSYLPFAPFVVDNVLGSTQETNCNPREILKKYNFKPLSLKDGFDKTLREQKINVAVVGLGKMGLVHLSILNTFESIQIKALIDTNKALFSTIKSMGIPGNFYNDLNEALKKEKIDAVFILTPTFTHQELLTKAMEKDLNVFIEKPVTLNINEVENLKHVNSKSIVKVGYTLLFNRLYVEVKKLIDEKSLGNIISFEANFKHSEVLKPKLGWMYEKQYSGGGVMMNPGPHLFSLLNYYFGKPKNISGTVKKIYSKDVDDEAKLNLDYKDFSGKVFLSWSVKNHLLAENEIKINFTQGELMVNGKVLEIRKGNKTEKIKFENLANKSDAVFNINPDANGEAYYLEDQQFIQAIKSKNGKSFNDLKNALDVESIIYNSYKSANIYD